MHRPMIPDASFRLAEQHYAAGRHREAETELAALRRAIGDHPALLHLSALNWKALENFEAALPALKAAHRLAPRNSEIAVNLGNLLGKTGFFEQALDAYEAAISIDERLDVAWINKALTLQSMAKTQEARAVLNTVLSWDSDNISAILALASIDYEVADLDAAATRYDSILSIDPENLAAMRGRAKVALDRGESSTVERHEAALEGATTDMELTADFFRALDAEGDPRGLALLNESVRQSPSNLEHVSLLCLMRWEHGDRDAYPQPLETYLSAHPSDVPAWDRYSALISGTAGMSAAATAYRDAFDATGKLHFREMEARCRSSAGEFGAADALFAMLPSDNAAMGRARHALAKGDPETAERILFRHLETPDVPLVTAWAMIGLCWQMTSDDRLRWLHGQPGLIRIIDCGLAQHEVAAIANHLRTLHRTSARPIGQSVRGGSQTRGDLLNRVDPEIRQLRDVVVFALRSYVAGLPPPDPGHPVLRFNPQRLAIGGSWSVRLTDGGYHVSHIHPKGLLSSASYWLVPDLERSGGDPQAGWLELGGPPDDLKLPISAFETIEPRAGRLVLFPSTLHHGTRPFASGERITAAFDVIVR